MAIDVTARAMAANADSKAVTAYEIAVQEGYTGSEQDFADDMALLGTNAAAVNSAVRFDEDQNKTSTEQLQAQSNIGLDTSKGDINTQLANKANIDGSYDGMTSGLAGNFISNTFIEDAEPYNFRTSGGSADVGDREYLENLVGGTLALNQLVQNGNFANADGWGTNRGTLTASNNKGIFTAGSDVGSASYISKSLTTYKSLGHKYFVTAIVKPSANTKIAFRLYGTQQVAESVAANERKIISGIVSYTNESVENNLILYVNYGGGYLSEGDTVEIENVMAIDLTALFGTIKQTVGGTNYNSIADYVYSLGNTNGVAWLYKYFPKLNGGYVPYSAPKLESVCTDEHITVGLNQWDEQAEVGLIAIATGQNTNGTGIRSKNYCRCLPNIQYQCDYGSGSTRYIFWYDINKNFISYSVQYDPTSPTNAYYFRIRVDGITTYNDDISIKFRYDGEMDGVYAPYVSHTYPMGHETLRGIYMLDANGNLYLDPNTNDVKVSDGTITRRMSGSFDLSSVEWADGGNNRWATNRSNFPNIKVPPSNEFAILGISEKYPVVASNALYSDVNLIGFAVAQSSGLIYCRNGLATPPTGNLVYELATPTTESGTPYTYVEVVDNWGTERFTDYGVEQNTRAVAVPVGHVTKYPPDLKAKLEMSPESPDGDGDYIVRQSGGENSYVLLPKELPNDPTGGDGTYSLVCTVSGGVATKSWVADT